MKQFQVDQGIQILTSTPPTVQHMLSDLSDEWIHWRPAPGEWSAFDIVGHLIHGEHTDWIPRLEIALQNDVANRFEPFDRFAMFEESKGKSLAYLLDEFAQLRAQNIDRLKRADLSEPVLRHRASHPELGTVNVGQLLSTWVVHDLSHIAQIARVMAKRLTEDVGPWRVYLPVLDR